MKSGRVDVRYIKDGKEEKISDRHKLPEDLANGLILTLLKNISPETPKTVVQSEAPFFMGGPNWRIELVSPTWPRKEAAPPPSAKKD